MKRLLIPSLCLLLASCQGETPKKKVVRPVLYETVEPAKPFQTRIFSGLSKARLESKLSFRIPGRIEGLLVHVGVPVSQGDLIAQLDPHDALLQVEEADANVFHAQAEQKRASSDYARTRELYETESASRSELDTARARKESAKAQLDAAKTKLAIATRQLEYTNLKAPYDGHIAEVLVEMNENISAGEPIVVLSSDDAIEVSVAIPEVLIGLLKRGQEVSVTFDALPQETFPATITEVGILSGGGTTFPLTVQINNPSPHLRSGMSAEIALSFPQRGNENALYVSPQAVLEKDGVRFLFIIDQEEKVRKKEVDVGSLTSEGVEIVSGIEKGDRVVTAGIHFLQDGETVRIDGPGVK